MMEIKKEYGEALFWLSREKGILPQMEEEMKALYRVFSENPRYGQLLSSPAVPMSERLSLLEQSFGMGFHEYVLSFLKLLCENGYGHLFCECAEEFFTLIKLSSNRAKASIVSAYPLTEEQKCRLCEKLEQSSQKKIEAVYSVDPSLIGGIRVVMDETVIDGTVKKQLQKMKGVISQ